MRRYDRPRLLEPDGREAQSGYRYYTRGQTAAARAIALLRSMDMPIADIRRILTGASDAARRQLFRDHRARLEARLDGVRRLLAAVDTLTREDTMHVDVDGHRFTLGRGEQRLREVAGHYRPNPETISVDPRWLRPRGRS